ncbi:MAG: hypothetical protein HY023_06345 [Chloroflexi bacterium]|nr:hypothetical protein [Chloroflexota bacterium]
MNQPEKLPDEETKRNLEESLSLGEIVFSGGLGLLGYFVAEAKFASATFPLNLMGVLGSTVVASLGGYLIARIWERKIRKH